MCLAAPSHQYPYQYPQSRKRVVAQVPISKAHQPNHASISLRDTGFLAASFSQPCPPDQVQKHPQTPRNAMQFRTKAKPNQTKPASMSLPPKRHLNNQTKSKISWCLTPFPCRSRSVPLSCPICLSRVPIQQAAWKKNERHTPLFVPDQPHVVICSRPKNPTPPPQSKYQRAALHYITIIAFPRTRHPKSPASVRVGREKGKRRCEERKEGREREEGISKTKKKKRGKKTKKNKEHERAASPHCPPHPG